MYCVSSVLEKKHKYVEFHIYSNMNTFFACRTEPSKEMKAALKVLNDYLRKSPITSVPHNLKNASNIVQQEWFKVETCS
jgi:hypothetical protein